jgi:hypothetical protein
MENRMLNNGKLGSHRKSSQVPLINEPQDTTVSLVNIFFVTLFRPWNDSIFYCFRCVAPFPTNCILLLRVSGIVFWIVIVFG